MPNDQDNRQDNKFCVIQTKSRKYGQCAFDIQDATAIQKVRLTLVNKSEAQTKANKKGTFVEHFMDIGDFLVIANDILNGSFKTSFYGETDPDPQHPQDRNKRKEHLGKYVEHKGSQKRESGKRVMEQGKPVLEARILEIEYIPGQRVPYHLVVSVGKGEKIGQGAVKMAGAPEKKCGIYLTEPQMKKMLLLAKLAIEGRMLVGVMAQSMSTNAFLPASGNGEGNEGNDDSGVGNDGPAEDDPLAEMY